MDFPPDLAAVLDPARMPFWLDQPVPPPGERPRLGLRTVWISDLHLGAPGCDAELLLDFLGSVECDTLFLVGDVIDMWRVRRRGWYWPPGHDAVARGILRLARNGTRVLYLPGNHDEALRDYEGLSFADVRIVGEMVHVTADGRRLLVLHGDRFDGIVPLARWLVVLGDAAYGVLLGGDRLVNRVRRRCGRPHWSLAGHAKKRVGNAARFVRRYEEAAARAARERGLDGVVCGHIHSAGIRTIDGVSYHNCGDWMESRTALVEHRDGAMALLDWAAIGAGADARGPAGVPGTGVSQVPQVA